MAASTPAPEAPATDPGFTLKGFSAEAPTDLGVVGRGFPAISADARQIAVTVEQTTSARAVPNMTLRIHDTTTWKVEQEIELLRFSEGRDIDFSAAGRSSRGALEAQIKPRVERANALFAGRGWRSLARARPETDPPWQYKVQRATLDDLVVSHEAQKITIREAAGRVLLERAVSWRLPSERALLPGHGPCSFEPYLHEAYVDRKSGVVLLLTGYSITHDACEAKTPRWSLVRLTP